MSEDTKKEHKDFIFDCKCFLKKIDIFGESISFNFKRNKRIKSSFGGWVSLMIVISCSIIFFLQFLQIANRKNLTVLDLSKYKAYPAFQNLSNWSFGMGFTDIITDLNHMENPELIMVCEWFNMTRTFINGKAFMSIKSTPVKLFPCQRNFFKGMEEDFDNNRNLKNYLCPDPNSKIILQGDFHSDIFYFLQVSIRRCNQTIHSYCPNRTKLNNKYQNESLFIY